VDAITSLQTEVEEIREEIRQLREAQPPPTENP
jgi:FtsZ-binding cell division protein ZapB